MRMSPIIVIRMTAGQTPTKNNYLGFSGTSEKLRCHEQYNHAPSMDKGADSSHCTAH